MEKEITEVTDLVMSYLFDTSKQNMTDKGQIKYRNHIEGIVNNNINRLYEIDGKITFQKNIKEHFPFLSVAPEEYRITDDILDKALLLCAEVNAYIKKKQFTPKESRIFYDIKKHLILNLYMFSDRIIEEWSEEREDGQIFISYKIRLSNNSTITFHQPFRNISDIIYRKKSKRDAILNNRRKYHHETDYVFNLTEGEKKEMYKKSSILTILNLVIKRYFVKQSKEEKF